jgi:hypothetical protein
MLHSPPSIRKFSSNAYFNIVCFFDNFVYYARKISGTGAGAVRAAGPDAEGVLDRQQEMYAAREDVAAAAVEAARR